MARKHPPAGYYTATVAKKKLGNISDGMLRSYVTRGKIKRVVPPERSQGFYSREDVDRMARLLDDFFVDDKPADLPGVQFMRATKEDIPECVELLIAVFGGGNTVERRQAWLEKNPDTAFIVRSKGKIVGCAFILPLTPEKIDAIFADQSSASIASITADDIQPLEPGRPAYLYLASIAVKPSLSDLAKRSRGQTLLRGLVNFLEEMGRRGIPIMLLAARSETRDGITLLKHLGFTEIESATANRNFIVEVERSGIPVMLKYKAALRQYHDAQRIRE
jgi:N-acetylglutamate synthase-like GNAT family acetyltransferase